MASTSTHVHQPSFDETLRTGTKTVTNAGTAVALSATSVPCYEVLIQAKRTTGGRIYIGGSTVANDDSNGVYLTAGQSMTITAQNLTQIYINSTVNAEGVTFIYW